ncbi:MAG: hypothetical protein JXA77_09535 [Bacteroidales bacterium]|nr:hypothetical protein [Bacteroidales bacterium]MBN2817411.1 hypothetical protein [Bacteroidales bacterium]
MAADKGITKAFHFFADTNAVIKRENDTLIKGKAGILNYYINKDLDNVLLQWTPDFIEVSEAGDLAYTYGGYDFIVIDPETKDSTVYSGIFHTVWKKQTDNTWKYVWD